MKALSKEAEQRVCDAAVKIAAVVDSQECSPTEAAAQVAKEAGFEPDMIRLMCRGYNTGAVTAQRESASGILNKLATIPLADPEAVIAQLYPTKTAMLAGANAALLEGVDECYSQPPNFTFKAPVPAVMVKSAAYEQPAAKPTPTQLYKQAEGLHREIKEAAAALASAETSFYDSLDNLCDYFRSQKKAFTFGEASYIARQKFAASGEHLMRVVATRNGYQAGNEVRPRVPIDKSAAPYTLISSALRAAEKYAAARQRHADVTARNRLKIAELSVQIRRVSSDNVVEVPVLFDTRANRPAYSSEQHFEKLAANLASWLMATNATNNLRQNLFGGPTEDQLVQKQLEKLTDPEHEAALKRIRAQTLLHDLMGNDQVLSSHPPDQIMEAYNDLSQLAPRTAMQPAAARPVMRRWLTQGGIEPFEAKEVADLEKTLGQSQGKVPLSEEKTGHVRLFARRS